MPVPVRVRGPDRDRDRRVRPASSSESALELVVMLLALAWPDGCRRRRIRAWRVSIWDCKEQCCAREQANRSARGELVALRQCALALHCSVGYAHGQHAPSEGHAHTWSAKSLAAAVSRSRSACSAGDRATGGTPAPPPPAAAAAAADEATAEEDDDGDDDRGVAAVGGREGGAPGVRPRLSRRQSAPLRSRLRLRPPR
jgi:hypothetical protein